MKKKATVFTQSMTFTPMGINPREKFCGGPHSEKCYESNFVVNFIYEFQRLRKELRFCMKIESR